MITTNMTKSEIRMFDNLREQSKCMDKLLSLKYEHDKLITKLMSGLDD